ncbi:hypothetical protein [Paraburkholderia sp. BL21I4N1]|uniref:hypothetical protein n=1 Tax=Paraburkholderia sp. BL21I4N1 TaxID=1938801 RepID=UPI000CFDB279|nr:hypothetical protein [Paraburkholderia sp. BL21I4N1]PQV51840.1 hypothetical protein B0G83_10449 [Paraburkholderia sp. BL21I4N1]
MTTNPASKFPHVLSALLPPDARTALARAASEAASINDQFAREMHMEAAIARVKLQYPNYFKD